MARTPAQLFVTWLASRLEREDHGATAVEYGLMVALIATVIILAVIALGATLNGVFAGVESDLTTAITTGSAE